MAEVEKGFSFQFNKINSVMVPAGFPIRQIANELRVYESQDFTVPEDFTGDCIYISGCGAGAGGGGYYTGAQNTDSWGCGGGGGASAFRIPLAAKAGDLVRITVGAGGAAATNITGSEGGDGGSTVVENITATSENRNGELTPFIAKITLNGGSKGGYNTTANNGAIQGRTPLGGTIDGIFDSFVDIGFVVNGGSGGSGGARYVTSWSGGTTPSIWTDKGANVGSLCKNMPFDNSINDGTNFDDGGGGGGSLYAEQGFGVGGKGRASNKAATSGKNGFVIVEWD